LIVYVNHCPIIIIHYLCELFEPKRISNLFTHDQPNEAPNEESGYHDNFLPGFKSVAHFRGCDRWEDGGVMTPGFRSSRCLGTTGAAHASLRIILFTKVLVSLEVSMRKVDARMPACGGGCGKPYISPPGIL
jgi:hypothetical protein